MDTIATSIISSVGRLVVIFWTRIPGVHHDLDDRVRPVPAAEPEELVADGGNDRDQDDPAQDRAQQGLPADQAEGHDREDHDDHQELGAAARVGRRIRRTASVVSGSPASRAWIVMCSAPWYWKTRRTSGERPTMSR